jgi:nucleoside-diphosphate-sugar epimerase
METTRVTGGTGTLARHVMRRPTVARHDVRLLLTGRTAGDEAGVGAVDLTVLPA